MLFGESFLKMYYTLYTFLILPVSVLQIETSLPLSAANKNLCQHSKKKTVRKEN